MKNYNNYITENTDVDKIDLKDELIDLNDKNHDGVNDDAIRKLIDLPSEYDYEFNFSSQRFYQDPNQLIILMEFDEAKDLLQEDDNQISTFIDYQCSYNQPNEYVENEEIEYNLEDPEKEIMDKILKHFNVKHDYGDEKISDFFSLDYFDKYAEYLKSEISYVVQLSKEKTVKTIMKTFLIELEMDYGKTGSHDYNLEMIIDLDELVGEKTVFSWMKPQIDKLDLEELDYMHIHGEFREIMQFEINKHLTALLKDIKENDILNDDDFVKNLTRDSFSIKNLGGNFLKQVKSLEWQKKYVDDAFKGRTNVRKNQQQKMEELDFLDVIHPDMKKELKKINRKKSFNL